MSDQLNEILEMIQFYHDNVSTNHHPTESEIETHLVTPLFLALGWPRKYISFARYHGPGTRSDICLHYNVEDRSDNKSIWAIIEVKKHIHFNSSAKQLAAFNQAIRYKESANCREDTFIVATDGYSYKFSKNEDAIDLSLENLQLFHEYLGWKKYFHNED